MVSWLPHAAIPGLFALAFFPIARRWILMALPVVWLIDADYLVQSEHRAISHAVWWPLAIWGALVALWRKRDPTARFWEFAWRPGWPGLLMLAGYFWASHIFLDVFAGGVVLFYPLVDVNFYWFYQIRLNTGTNTFQSDAEVGTEVGAPALAPDYIWFSGEHNALFWFLVFAVVGVGLAWWLRRRRVQILWRKPRSIHKREKGS